MVQADFVEGVFERQTALDLMGLDHGGQDVEHPQGRLAVGDCRPRQPVGHRQDAAEVVRRMPPLGRQPGVVEVEPADHRADVERRLHGIQLVRSAGNLGAVGDDRSGNDRSEQLGAGRVLQCLQPAAKRVNQAVACRIVREFAADAVREDVVGNVGQHLIGLGTDIANECGHHTFRVGRKRGG